MARPFYAHEWDDPDLDRLANWLVCNDPTWIEVCSADGKLFFVKETIGLELALDVEIAGKAGE